MHLVRLNFRASGKHGDEAAKNLRRELMRLEGLAIYVPYALLAKRSERKRERGIPCGAQRSENPRDSRPSLQAGKPSERCASATRPSGALSFRQEIIAPPILRNRPLDFNHLDSSEFGSSEYVSDISCLGDVSPAFKLHTLQFTRHTILSGFLRRLQYGFFLLTCSPPCSPKFAFFESTSKYATSASYEL
nr:hypothetical protein Iba_chr05bCG11050 [Ipomoea batatas]